MRQTGWPFCVTKVLTISQKGGWPFTMTNNEMFLWHVEWPFCITDRVTIFSDKVATIYCDKQVDHFLWQTGLPFSLTNRFTFIYEKNGWPFTVTNRMTIFYNNWLDPFMWHPGGQPFLRQTGWPYDFINMLIIYCRNIVYSITHWCWQTGQPFPNSFRQNWYWYFSFQKTYSHRNR